MYAALINFGGEGDDNYSQQCSTKMAMIGDQMFDSMNDSTSFTGFDNEIKIRI